VHIDTSSVDAVPAELRRVMPDDELSTRMESNEIIPIAHGWALIPDYRSAGWEDDRIPADEFTAYFADKKIPYASSGINREHDFIHGPSYRDLFQSYSFGDVVARAAMSAIEHVEFSAFAGAIDLFGNMHIYSFLDESELDVETSYNYLQKGRFYLRRLIRRWPPGSRRSSRRSGPI
jgi:hypothetical protein